MAMMAEAIVKAMKSGQFYVEQGSIPVLVLIEPNKSMVKIEILGDTVTVVGFSEATSAGAVADVAAPAPKAEEKPVAKAAKKKA